MEFYSYLCEALIRWQKKKQTIKDAINQAKADLETRDFPQFHQNYKGIIENYAKLEGILEKYSKMPLKKYRVDHLMYMYIGIYGLLFLRKADYAITSQIIDQIKKVAPGLASMSNGILRSIGRDKNKILREETPLEETFSVHPDLLEAMKADYEEQQIVRYLEKTQTRRPLEVLSMIDRSEMMDLLRQAGYEVEELPFTRHGIRILKTIRPIIQEPLFEQGKLYIQSMGSQLIGQIAADLPGRHVLDLCAAPGGKSISMYRERPDRHYTLNDQNKSKIEKINDNIHRLKLKNMHLSIFDASKLVARWIQAFDIVLLDAPCSASGILQKEPEAKLLRDKAGINYSVDLQIRMLEHAARYVKKEGFLIYSTCSILSRENEAQIEAFLEKNPAFQKVPIDLDPALLQDGCFKLTPFSAFDEGFFGCVLQKVSA